MEAADLVVAVTALEARGTEAVEYGGGQQAAAAGMVEKAEKVSEARAGAAWREAMAGAAETAVGRAEVGLEVVTKDAATSVEVWTVSAAVAEQEAAVARSTQQLRWRPRRFRI